MVKLGRVYKKRKDIQDLLDVLYPPYIILMEDATVVTAINGPDYTQYRYIEVDKPDKLFPISRRTLLDTFELMEEEDGN